MKNYKPIKYLLLPVFGLLAMLNTHFVYAASGDTVSNIATINYSVGSVAQSAIGSSSTGNTSGAGTATTFVIDRLLSVTVAEVGASNTTVTPNEQNAVLTYTVTNTGNSIQDFLLSARALTTDNFDATGVQVFVESGATAGYQLAQDTGVFVDELAVGATVTVYVIGDIPASQTNGQLASYALVAQVAAGGAATTQGAAITNDDNNNASPAGTYSNGATAVAAGTPSTTADNPATVQSVFGDAAGDLNSAGAADIASNGQHSDTDTYQVGAAALTVTKTATVISDPISGTGANRKAIPGAILEYTVTIANAAGAATAQAVTITDSLSAEITGGRLSFNTADFNGALLGGAACALDPCGMQVTAPTINGGAAQNITNLSDADAGDFTANVLTLNAGNLAAGENATFRFRVTIQ